jgi:NADH dehydrogenase FAD-containing subunit
MASPPRVVVVGGGQAGADVAQALAGIADVTLVDP